MRDRAVESAAAQPVGTDLMSDHREQTRGIARGLVAVALTGSTAAGDAEVEIFIANQYIGRIQNIRTGTVLADEVDWQPMNHGIPPGEKLQARISDVGVGNVLVFHFVTVP